jgi:hypothetical protein
MRGGERRRKYLTQIRVLYVKVAVLAKKRQVLYIIFDGKLNGVDITVEVIKAK